MKLLLGITFNLHRSKVARLQNKWTYNVTINGHQAKPTIGLNDHPDGPCHGKGRICTGEQGGAVANVVMRRRWLRPAEAGEVGAHLC